MKKIRVIIAGGRYFNNYKLLCQKLTVILKNIDTSDIEIVSGGANGADSLGERFAREKGLPVKKFPADWNAHGKAAGPIRNAEMAEYATHLIAFWDGKSRGTKNMIDLMQKNGKPFRVIRY